METRGQLVGVSSLFAPEGFQGLNSGHRLSGSVFICWATLLATSTLSWDREYLVSDGLCPLDYSVSTFHLTRGVLGLHMYASGFFTWVPRIEFTLLSLFSKHLSPLGPPATAYHPAVFTTASLCCPGTPDSPTQLLGGRLTTTASLLPDCLLSIYTL